jgi:hypothetical protein
VENQENARSPLCYGYGRLSTALPNLTRAAQEELVRRYWLEHLQPAGVEPARATPRSQSVGTAERFSGKPAPAITLWHAGLIGRFGLRLMEQR